MFTYLYEYWRPQAECTSDGCQHLTEQIWTELELDWMSYQDSLHQSQQQQGGRKKRAWMEQRLWEIRRGDLGARRESMIYNDREWQEQQLEQTEDSE
jgi:hypothetical protein